MGRGSVPIKRGLNLVNRWVRDKGTGVGVYGYGVRHRFSFSLGQYTTVFQAEVCALKHVLMMRTMLSGSTVTTAWRVLGLQIEEIACRYGG
jgi:hypothetical protein